MAPILLLLEVYMVQVRKMLYIMLFFIMLSMKSSSGELVPALFWFGDSLADVGNNNHLPSLVRADFPQHGIDFPTHKPNGRFSNGKNGADFLAEKLGLPSSPAYLYLTHIKSSNFSTGVNFASGGAEILDGPDQLYRQSLTMNEQTQLYAIVQEAVVQQMGQAKANDFLSKSIFAIVVGSNDILEYFGSSSSSRMQQATPQEYVASMVQAIEGQLKNIYDLGARKFVIIGVSSVGCTPDQRRKNKTEDCNDVANFWASKYNQGLLSVLHEFQSKLQDFQYSYFNTYDVLLNFIQQPANYGFKEVKAACCGLGILKASVACLPISTYCDNRRDHVFWDFYHPSEAAHRIFIDIAFNGPKQYVFPMNVHELVSS